jgi:glucose/arabinose dehydrogenase
VTTFAGGVKGFADGQGAQARFSYPRDVAADAAGNLYVADTTNRRIRKITPEGRVTTVAGTGKRGHTDGPGRMATFQSPWGLGAGPDGTIVVADTSGHAIRRVAPDGRVTTIAGAGVAGFANGKGTKARFYLPRDVAFTPGGSVLVADAGNHRVRRILQDGTVVTLAGSEAFGYADGRAEVAMFGYITGIAVEADGSALVTDETHHCIRRITPDGTVTTLAGRNQEGWIDGPGPLARFHWPTNVALGPGFCYVADPGNFRIRKIALP